MIVGTAGHIDHGKTTLVRALTGVDTDRLPEEKRRGISLDLGFAFLDAPDGHRIGFIDVPGHERLVHTMLAGATGIDHGLLVVAADDGVMPQTREHLAVLSLLGIDEGLIVITKADRVDAARIAAVRDEVAALVATTPLATAPVFVVAAPGGDGAMEPRGIGEIIAHLAAAAARQHRVDDGRAFRLAVDRAFTLDGVGVVVGSASSSRARLTPGASRRVTAWPTFPVAARSGSEPSMPRIARSTRPPPASASRSASWASTARRCTAATGSSRRWWP